MFDRHADAAVHAAADPLDTELEAYNRAFTELELPWHWDVATLRHLRSVAPGEDCVGAYIERNHAHLLRVYDKTFLCELVRSAKERHSA